jgi:methylated-DNA-[protein]-cysteine S-methyltransferase
LGIRTGSSSVLGVKFLPPGTPPQAAQNELAARVCAQLAAYLDDPRFVFDLPVQLDGTPFRMRVWQALRTIAPGEILTYGELARRIGSAPRAVGQACGANPLPVIVPCHRVVARNGLGGFMNYSGGEPLAIKRWLLRHEQTDRRSA